MSQKNLGGTVFLVDGGQRFGQLGIRVGITEVSPQVVKAVLESVPRLGAVVLGLEKASDLLAKLFETQVVNGNPEDSKLLGQEVRFPQVIECWNQFAHGQVSGSSEDDHHAGPCGFASMFEFVVSFRHRRQRHFHVTSVGAYSKTAFERMSSRREF
jgi:hypothetical protein